MYEVDEKNKSYEQKWLEAERDLALISWATPPCNNNGEELRITENESAEGNDGTLTNIRI